MALPKNIHRADIVAAVRKRGTNLSELGRRNGLGDSTLRVALSHPRTPSNKIIAAFLGLELHQLWPVWFDASGKLRSPQGSRRRLAASSQKRDRELRLTGGRA
jgi:Ner family transcriptional regulator